MSLGVPRTAWGAVAESEAPAQTETSLDTSADRAAPHDGLGTDIYGYKVEYKEISSPLPMSYVILRQWDGTLSKNDSEDTMNFHRFLRNGYI